MLYALEYSMKKNLKSEEHLQIVLELQNISHQCNVCDIELVNQTRRLEQTQKQLTELKRQLEEAKYQQNLFDDNLSKLQKS